MDGHSQERGIHEFGLQVNLGPPPAPEPTLIQLVSNPQKRPAKVIYRHILNSQEFHFVPKKVIAKWNRDLETDDTLLKWEQVASQVKQLISCRMKSFHLLFINRAQATRSLIFNWGLVSSPYCVCCEGDRYKTFFHRFWECPEVRELWAGVFSVLQKLDPRDEYLELDRDRVMLGLYPKSRGVILLIVTIIKMYINQIRIEDDRLEIREVWRRIV